MSHPYQYHNFVMREIPRSTERALILDAGSGLGIWGYLLMASRGESVRVVGIDSAWPYLRFARQRNVYDGLVHGDLRSLPFKSMTFDYIIAVEVLEHLPKANGWKFLNELARCCKHRIVLTTPNGFRPQEVPGAPTETHLSGWTVRELRDSGFAVRGIGSRVVPLDYDRLVLSAIFHYLGTPVAQAIPELGEWLIAVKTVDTRNAGRTSTTARG